MTSKLLEKFILSNKISETTRLGEMLAEFTEKHDIPTQIAFRLDLVLDELITNIIKYGYKDLDDRNMTQKIHIEIYHESPNYLKVILIDCGIEFDPLQVEMPEITTSLEDRPVGGLGVFFAKQFTDKMSYERRNSRNYLTMLIDLNKKLTL